MEIVEKCIICGGKKFDSFLTCRDNLVSKKDFELVKCDQCGFVFTNPRPDIGEISMYYESDEYLSHNSDKQSFISLVYNQVRSINIKRKLKLVKQCSKPYGSLLDYGCGVGEFLKSAIRSGWNGQGIEPSDNARAIAIKSGLTIGQPNELAKIQDNIIDTITLWHVIEHIHNLNDVLVDLKRVLKENGTFVVAVPNFNSWDAYKYQSKWAAYDVPRHLYHFSSDTVKMLFSNIGMRIVSIHPMKFDSYYVSLLSEGKSKKRYIHALINGYVSNRKARKSNNYSSLIYVIKS